MTKHWYLTNWDMHDFHAGNPCETPNHWYFLKPNHMICVPKVNQRDLYLVHLDEAREVHEKVAVSAEEDENILQ